jgi:hypothetical protein
MQHQIITIQDSPKDYYRFSTPQPCDEYIQKIKSRLNTDRFFMFPALFCAGSLTWESGLINVRMGRPDHILCVNLEYHEYIPHGQMVDLRRKLHDDRSYFKFIVVNVLHQAQIH